ncbi:CPA1 family monovalent cation:H+ antiporter [Microbacterium terrae]|uniref:Na(+)/H(+) antiporter ApNhaP n=1 Tax=Microbacterium terrae TaxID=69369 RepID=A0A0M2H3L6_9MICO|nr:Na+/H+ antiporter [Microbacterium terrae]KJL38400.1 Na(+)/H(+) antiporter ApNhaP [Microbacterium terrae]MBP1078958.1 CPA1 family monovalent cation:H+ antiporter [Microbacterium terrae]GLJ98358.1 putative Na(+)/H(+) exchanger [Microbacterium terrae]
MNPLEIIVLVGVLVLLGSWLGPRVRVPAPLLQLAVGLLAGFVPVVREIHLPPEAVLVLFLPALLFWESLTTSLREIRRDLRGILILSTLLVVASAFGVAGIGVALGLGWSAALILGAALAPTDATAVGAMARALPHRNMTILRAESLINDGTALVVYSIAVGAAVSHLAYTGWQITGLVALAYLGGGAMGLLTGWLGTLLLRRLTDPVVNNTALVVIPFVAFLAAELIHASGVIAVVIAGLMLSQTGPRASTPQSRQQTFAFWSLSTSILNGALFVLIGIEAQSAVRAVPTPEIPTLLALTVLAWIAIVVIRFVFQMITVSLIRLLDRRPSQRTRRMSHRARVVSAIAGFRGAISLAVALAVPATLSGRAEIIFVATGVVILTLVVQGVLLPPVVRWAGFAPDSSLDDELATAQRTATAEAARDIPELAARLHVTDLVRDRILGEYTEHLDVIEGSGQPDDQVAAARDVEYTTLRLAVLERKRDVMIRLRDEGTINDTTLRTMQTRLDREALRLSQPEILE